MPHLSRFIVVSLTGVFLIPPCGAQNSSQTLLQRRISVEHQVSSASQYINTVALTARIPSGVESYLPECGKEAEHEFPNFTGTITAALDKVSSGTDSYTWKEEHGTLLVQGANRKPSVLDIVVKSFSFRPNEPVLKTSGNLFSLPEVLQYMTAQGLTQWGPEIGFAQFKKKNKKPEAKVTLNNVSVREALEAIASAGHPKVWFYTESSCNRKRSFSLNWTLK